MTVTFDDETDWEVADFAPGRRQKGNLPGPPAAPDLLTATRTLLRTELYDLESDPGELNNLAERDPRRVAELNRLLDDWERRHEPAERPPEAIELDPSTVEELRALAYSD